MNIQLRNTDLLCMDVCAIVNPANTQLLMGGGVCGAIFRAAGIPQMQAACHVLAPIRTGEAVLTPGFALKADYVIHTAGPIWQGGTKNEATLLRDCYLHALALAQAHQLSSIAFPLISAGLYGYPKQEALRIALDALSSWQGDLPHVAYLVLLDKSDVETARELLKG